MLLFELNELSASFILRIYSVFILEYSNRICPFLYIYLWPYATENARMKKIEFWENKLIFRLFGGNASTYFLFIFK